jgi:hypothetical protein
MKWYRNEGKVIIVIMGRIPFHLLSTLAHFFLFTCDLACDKLKVKLVFAEWWFTTSIPMFMLFPISLWFIMHVCFRLFATLSRLILDNFTSFFTCNDKMIYTQSIRHFIIYFYATIDLCILPFKDALINCCQSNVNCATKWNL